MKVKHHLGARELGHMYLLAGLRPQVSGPGTPESQGPFGYNAQPVFEPGGLMKVTAIVNVPATANGELVDWGEDEYLEIVNWSRSTSDPLSSCSILAVHDVKIWGGPGVGPAISSVGDFTVQLVRMDSTRFYKHTIWTYTGESPWQFDVDPMPLTPTSTSGIGGRAAIGLQAYDAATPGPPHYDRICFRFKNEGPNPLGACRWRVNLLCYEV